MVWLGVVVVATLAIAPGPVPMYTWWRVAWAAGVQPSSTAPAMPCASSSGVAVVAACSSPLAGVGLAAVVSGLGSSIAMALMKSVVAAWPWV